MTGLSGYQYVCYGSNPKGVVQSTAATLTVNPPVAPPAISLQPSDTAAGNGASASFTAAAAGASVSYRWQRSSDGGVSWTDLQDGTGISGAGSATSLSLAVLTVFSCLGDWSQQHFGTMADAGAAADVADPDLGGRSNLLEYALGSSPTTADQDNGAVAGAVTDGAGTHLTLTFNRIADSTLTYAVEASDEIANWAPIWTSAGAQNAAGAVVVTDGETVENHPRRLLRLRVSN